MITVLSPRDSQFSILDAPDSTLTHHILCWVCFVPVYHVLWGSACIGVLFLTVSSAHAISLHLFRETSLIIWPSQLECEGCWIRHEWRLAAILRGNNLLWGHYNQIEIPRMIYWTAAGWKRPDSKECWQLKPRYRHLESDNILCTPPLSPCVFPPHFSQTPAAKRQFMGPPA